MNKSPLYIGDELLLNQVLDLVWAAHNLKQEEDSSTGLLLELENQGYVEIGPNIL